MAISYVYNKLLKFTSIFFYKIRDQVNTDVLRMIYFAFVHPIYCIALKFMEIHIKHICLNY